MNLQTSSDKKRITFIGFIMIAYFAAHACYNKPIVLYTGFILLCGFIVLDKLLSSDRMKVIFPTSCKWLYYFVVYCFFSRIWAVESYYVSNLCGFLIPVAVLVFICINYFIKARDINSIIAAIAVSGIALSVYAVINEGGLGAFYHNATVEKARIGGQITNVNSIGIFGAISTVVLIYYGLYAKKRLFLPLAVIPFMAAAASGSKKAILILAAGIFLMVVLAQQNKKGIMKFLKITMGICIGLLLLRVVMSLEIMSTINDRMEQMIKDLISDSNMASSSTLMRKRLIEIGWRQFLETPYLGVGLGNSVIVNGRAIGFWAYSHNDYVEHLVNGGVFGFLIYYGNIFNLAVQHIKLMKRRKDNQITISFIILCLYLVMSAGCVNYYGNMQTYLYFILWITVVEVKKREFANLKEDADEKKEEDKNADIYKKMF